MSCKSPIGEEFTNFAFLETLQGAKAYFQESVWCVCASVCLCAWSGGGSDSHHAAQALSPRDGELPVRWQFCQAAWKGGFRGSRDLGRNIFDARQVLWFYFILFFIYPESW